MRLSLPIVRGRSCGECSACCTSLGVEEINKPRDTPCPHLTGPGACGIYETRPPSCQSYSCLWLLGLIEGDERRRPDKLGVIFDTGSTLPDCITCREVVAGASETEQVRYLIKKLQGRNWIVYVMRLDGGRQVFGRPDRIREILSAADMVEIDMPGESRKVDILP